MTRRETGILGEKLAAGFLREKGYIICAANYRCAEGEVDIVARQGETLVFVEVKARSSNRFGNAKGAVTPTKQRKISMAALDYLKRSGQTEARARFDVVAIDTAAGKTAIEVVKNAFSLAYG